MNIESSEETNCGMMALDREESMESSSEGKERNGTESPVNGDVSSVPGESEEEKKEEEEEPCDEEDFPMEDEDVEEVKLEEAPTTKLDEVIKVEEEKDDKVNDAEMEDTTTLDKIMITDDNNNTTLTDHDQDLVDLRQIKLDKNLKLKQLQIELKNEEAKLILFKRLYYSQRITPPAPNAQSLAAQQKAPIKPTINQQINLKSQQPMKPVLNGNSNVPTAPVIGGQPQRASILNKKVCCLYLNQNH